MGHEISVWDVPRRRKSVFLNVKSEILIKMGLKYFWQERKMFVLDEKNIQPQTSHKWTQEHNFLSLNWSISWSCQLPPRENAMRGIWNPRECSTCCASSFQTWLFHTTFGVFLLMQTFVRETMGIESIRRKLSLITSPKLESSAIFFNEIVEQSILGSIGTYVWEQPESPTKLTQEYEGRKK